MTPSVQRETFGCGSAWSDQRRPRASERFGRPFVEIGVHDLASLVRAMAEALKKRQRAA